MILLSLPPSCFKKAIWGRSRTRPPCAPRLRVCDLPRQVALPGDSSSAPLRSRAAAARKGGDTSGPTSNYVTGEVPLRPAGRRGAPEQRAFLCSCSLQKLGASDPRHPRSISRGPSPVGVAEPRLGDLGSRCAAEIAAALRRCPGARRVRTRRRTQRGQVLLSNSARGHPVEVRGSRSRLDGSVLRGSSQNVRACIVRAKSAPRLAPSTHLESSSGASTRTAGLGGSSAHRVIEMQVHFRAERIFSVCLVGLYLLYLQARKSEREGEKKIHV